MLHNVILAPYLCNRLFSIIRLLNLVRNFLFHKGFCMVYFRAKEKNAVTLPHISQRKHAFWRERKEISKTKQLPYRNKIALELLHKILDHRSTILLFSGYTDNVWEDIELRIDPYPFCT